MKKPPRKRRHQRRRAVTRPPPLETTPSEMRISSLTKVLRSVWTKVFAATVFVIGGLVGIPTWLGAFDTLRDLYQKPALSIHLAGSDKNAFALPFIVKNEGHFTAYDLSPACIIESMEETNGSTTEMSAVSVSLGYTQINPNEEKIASCGIDSSGLKRAKIFYKIAYKSLWLLGGTAKRRFTWYPNSSPPRWVESD